MSDELFIPKLEDEDLHLPSKKERPQQPRLHLEQVPDELANNTTLHIPKVKLNTGPVCPRCNKPMVKAVSVAGSLSTGWLECPECGTLVNTFTPLPHQVEFLKRPETYKMSAGGYGTGKTKEDIEDVTKHVCLIPNAVVCVAARTYPALESTFIKDFYSVFPKRLIKSKNDQKHELYLTNGSMIMFRSFDDPTKLKSLNLTMAVIVEASDVSYDSFTMLQTRIRNTAAMIPEYDINGNVVTDYDAKTGATIVKYITDARHINLETNPASNWIKGKFLQDSHIVRYFGSAADEGYSMSDDPDKNKYTQIVSTDANPHLPTTYIEENSKGKSQAWIKQFLFGSFNFNQNLVFPNFGLCIKQTHKLPREFNEYGKRVLWYAIGLDYGIVDNTHIVFTALSTEEHKLYVYDELVINNADVKTIAKEYRRELKINGTHLNGLLMLPRFDGRSYNKRESDLYTIGGMFEAEGLYFEPSFTQHEIRIIKLNALINHNQIEVFSDCEYLIDEFLNYEYKKDKNGNPTDKPEDGNDHGITALEFVVVELPHNLQELELEAYVPAGTEFKHDTHDQPVTKKKTIVYDPFKEDTYGNKNYSNVWDSDFSNSSNTFSIVGTYAEDDEDNGGAEEGTMQSYIIN